ncbi:NUDIX hydrolase [Tengunoibacter tsumagoiensis]|uniref:DNA mismatch repair protein MutT n=1 Tax=Tengunoibacter tsumagoiensis TaxID=2014871 RepID=A0A401ZWF8_9CHLR|nr:NUDIX hydrolase [Tengunoibacter tsumagoiensis]GCE11110.1 DNA mismatch repair protein MutT [Tengunoibacter tsumagoiensis]
MAQERPWEVLATRQVLDTPYLKIRSEHLSLPDGSVLSDYYIIENRGWVGVVPITEDGRFLINRQYKHGIGLEVVEFPAGGIDEHEADPLLAANRELMEETGYSAEPTKIEFLAHMLANPTSAETRIWWYLARDVRKTGEKKIDPAEVIDNMLVTPAELLQLIHSGEFSVQGQIAAAYMALEKLGYLKAHLS